MQEKIDFATAILVALLAWLTRLAVSTEATTIGRELRRLFVTLFVGGIAYFSIPSGFEYGYFAVAFFSLIADDVVLGIAKIGASIKKDPVGFLASFRKGGKK